MRGDRSGRPDTEKLGERIYGIAGMVHVSEKRAAPQDAFPFQSVANNTPQGVIFHA
jgi:hypothetical protein